MTRPPQSVPFTLRPQAEADTPAIDALLDEAFGPGRYAKPSYRLREGGAPVAGLSFVGASEEGLVGSIRFWPVAVRGGNGAATPALLLGPLAVRPDLHGRGIGLALMARGLEAAAAAGHRLVILVGDLPYYARAGFSRVPARQLRMPQPYDPARLLWRELVAGACDGVSGVLAPAR